MDIFYNYSTGIYLPKVNNENKVDFEYVNADWVCIKELSGLFTNVHHLFLKNKIP